MTADEMLRKRTNDLRNLVFDALNRQDRIMIQGGEQLEKYIAAALEFAAEQSARARAEAMAECKQVILQRAEAWALSVAEGSETDAYETKVLMDCAEAISRLSPAGKD